MMVLTVIGIALLVLLGLGVLLLSAVLLLPARVEFRRRMPDGPLRLRIGFGPLRRVFALGKKAKKKPKKPKKQPEKPQKQPKEKPPRAPLADFKRLDYAEAFALAVDLLDDLTGSVTWERLRVTVLLHTPDAARTGNLLGTLSALIGNLYPYFARAFVLWDVQIVLDADFDAAHTVWGADISAMTRLSRFPPIIWRRRKALWGLWKSVRLTKGERAQWLAEHAARDEQAN